jgi:AGZA family xanthine/uracil permease-like MFS transporter
VSALAGFFDFAGRRTSFGVEVRAGITTFMVMAYIIFVNPIVLGYVGVPGLEGKGLPFAATLTVTCLTAGVMSIAMGLTSNYPLAMAPGMGLNAGFVVKPTAGPLPVGLGVLRGLPVLVFLIGFLLTAVLVARRVRGGLLVGIVATTVIAIALNGLFAG